MAEARNYHDHEAGSSLDDDIEQWREESEVEICRSDGDPESDLLRRQEECKKNPDHVDFIPEPEFTIEHLPVEWRNPWVYKQIRETARGVVHLSVKYTSPQRPDRYIFSEYRGSRIIRCGTGFVLFPPDYENKPPQQCPLKNCKEFHPHNVTPEFEVATASHVVYDSSEAEQTEIRFFFDCKNGTKGKAEITAQGLRLVESNGRLGESCTFTCVSHNLNIRDLCESDTEEGQLEPTPSAFDTEEKKQQLPFRPTGTKEKIPEQSSGPPQTEEKKPEPQFSPMGTKEKIPEQPSSYSNEEEKKPEQPFGPPHTEEKRPALPISPTEEKTFEPPLRDTNSKKRKPLVVIVSHPHGCSKHVSTGDWTGVKSMQSFFLKSVGNITFRDLKEKLTQNGLRPELIESLNIAPDETFRQMIEDKNISYRDFKINFSHDMPVILACPFTFNEITHKMLLGMWEKTTSNSTLSGQVSEEELSEIALSVVTDILPIKSSDLKKTISKYSLKMWETLTSDQNFSRQLCREEVSETCKRVVNNTFGPNSLSFQKMLEKGGLLLTSISNTKPTDHLFFESYPPIEGCKVGDEADIRLIKIREIIDVCLNNPDSVKNFLDRMLYSTNTCPGSSGAPVLLLYDEDNGEIGFNMALHCGAIKGKNMSSAMYSIRSLFEKLNPTDKLKQELSQEDIPLD